MSLAASSLLTLQPQHGTFTSSLLLQGALLASLDVVPVFFGRPQRRVANNKKSKSSSKSHASQELQQDYNNDNDDDDKNTSSTSLVYYYKYGASYHWLLMFRVATSGLFLALLGRQDDAYVSNSNNWRLVLPMLLRRIVTPIITRAWPRLVAAALTDHNNDDNGKMNNEATDKTATGTTTTRNNDNNTSWLQFLADGGPLGPGCGKLVQSSVGLLFAWAFQPRTATTIEASSSLSAREPNPLLLYCHLGPLWSSQTWWLLVMVAALSLAVNGVLWAWSHLEKSKGTHDGVNRMVASTVGRSLTIDEHLRLWTWAWINATCEEITARGLQRGEYHALFFQSSLNQQQHRSVSNIGQALVFGVAHYHGIPNGWTGVGLTFVYGLLMGFIADAGQGLLYPILTHTVADYFIFATTIARRKEIP